VYADRTGSCIYGRTRSNVSNLPRAAETAPFEPFSNEHRARARAAMGDGCGSGPGGLLRQPRNEI